MPSFKLALALLFICPSWATAAQPIPNWLKQQPLTQAQRVKIETLLRVTPDQVEPFEHRPGGRTTVSRLSTADAFSQHSENLSFEEQGLFKVGNGIFKKLWVSAPASTEASDGLGPMFNARSCQHCHLKDGRSAPPAPGEYLSSSLFLRLGNSEGKEDPNYGIQLQTSAIQGVLPEATVALEYEPILATYPNNESIELQAPQYHFVRMHYGELSPSTRFSGRTAPMMIGLGLLEAIPDERILALADPEDTNSDGISGRINWVESKVKGEHAIGRFNWKASAASLRDQVVDAFHSDLGLSTPEHREAYGDCTKKQENCREKTSGGDPEVTDDMVRWVTLYSRNLGVPERVDAAGVLEGKALFHQVGCASCHTPSHVTGKLNEIDELSLNLIYPYTDLLLHDMGDGLADGVTAGSANGREWRTAPLWGIGLIPQVNGHQQLLHDGRAKGVEEAILWHAGEAEAAATRFKSLAVDQRDQLIKFVNSL